ncbi:HD1 homeodomain transcription factor A mating type protein [Agaricus bisporus var. bisporus H97]|uniref:HD1 homeodomain transcription factor A mating type protein n=1 Tax=Agaricus bisporus var. bisporus (strain H97 / ATCC MYA-4626 / FGSC 10389) TaxID=936046 RepID=UPI00029F5102|nr:HD1 homeodomain transcription factor A mating type protein [Agaricus bisporus var. bisporus H97]EKV52039.1 HD1 homeodomain transcription factor A mating type protein [Agaricus bisporus var. bisporus H97]
MTVSSIRKRLLQAEESFLAASNERFMEDFEQTWNTLAVDIVKATSANQMSPEDKSLADIVSSRITSLCKTFIDLTYPCDDISLSSEQELERILEEHESGNHGSQSRSSEETLHPAPALYIKQAYSWLMQNLSNPYPPKEVREAIARKAGSDPKHVENWFGDVRKRMGWNGIRKRHFSNKRHLTVAAATAFFGGQSSELLTDLVRQDFAAMSADAEDMYSKKFMESKLARHIAGVTGSPRKKPSQSASVENETSSSYNHPLFHPSLPHTQCNARKRFRSLDSTDEVLDINNFQKRPRFSYSGDSSPAASHSPLPSTSPQSPVPHAIPATFQMNRQTSEFEDHLPPSHPSADSRSVSLQSVLELNRTSCNPSPSSSTLPSDVSDEPITSQYIPNEATKRSDSVSMASFQQSPTLHSSALSLLHNTLPSSLLSRKENTQFPTEFQAPVTYSEPVVTQGFALAPSASDITHDTLFSGSTANDRFLAISSSDFAPRDLSSAQDVNATSWPATIANTQTDGQFFGYLDPLPTETTFTAQVDALPDFADVDLTFGNLFDLDASAAFPPSDPDFDTILPANRAENLATNDLFTLTPAVESSVSKFLQLEQLKKHRNRIQEYINTLEIQIATTLAA